MCLLQYIVVQENIFMRRLAVVQVVLDVVRVILVKVVLQEHIIRQVTRVMGVPLAQ